MSVSSGIRIAGSALSMILFAACGGYYQRVSEPSVSNFVLSQSALNINTATTDELQRIPHIGENLAMKIVRYREANGPFRRVEHLMLISGISDRRFRKIRHLVKAE